VVYSRKDILKVNIKYEEVYIYIYIHIYLQIDIYMKKKIYIKAVRLLKNRGEKYMSIRYFVPSLENYSSESILFLFYKRIYIYTRVYIYIQHRESELCAKHCETNHAKRERERDPIALFYSEGKVAKSIVQ